MNTGILLMISTDRKIFQEGSAVRERQKQYAQDWKEVHIIVFAPASVSRESVIAANCWAYATQSWSKFLYSYDAIGLGTFLIKKRGITSITCQDSSLTAMAGVALKKKFHIPLEIQIHEDIGSPNFTYSVSNRIRKMLALTYIPKADTIRVVSNKIKDYLIGSLKIDPSKITVRPIHVDVEKIKNSAIREGADLHKKYPYFEKIVLIASRLTREKNVALAINAWKDIIAQKPRVGLVIVGEGPELSRIQSSVRSSNIQSSVVFESWADQETLISYYKTANLFLNTSLFEGYGMALVEAQAAGCPIVSTDVGVARDVGATIVPWDPGAVAQAVIDALG